MSNNEGNPWTPGRENAPNGESEGFGTPSEVPPSPDDVTTQHQPPYPGNNVGDPTGRYQLGGSQAPQDHWAAPADNYARFASDPGAAPSYIAESPAKKKRGFGWLKWLAVILVSALVGGLAGAITNEEDGTGTPTRSSIATPAQASTQEATPSNIREVLNKVQKAVVTISVNTIGGDGSGTGMIVSSDGEILTNNHVVSGARSIEVTFDGETEPRSARLLGTDSTIDSALIKVDGVSGLPTVEFGDSANVQVGDDVVAIGNALALTGGPSVTAGIISAKDRSITDAGSSLDNLIQTDTAINPGNSGGPLANMAGQVIGMNTAVIRGESGQFENIGFAIAINTVAPAIESLRSGATKEPAYLGLNPVTLDDDIKNRFDLSPDEGVVVSQVQSGSPADSAGLSRFDVITKVDDKKITTSDQLVTYIRGKKPGDKVSITFFRGDVERTVTATLVARPSS